jgi:radical SAM protein with 4Fe4S-binding SPASM domain
MDGKMKINKIELREHQRVHLGKAAPLPAPLSLYLEPTSICNMRCEFCPTGDPVLRRRRPNGTMDLALVEKLVRDVQDWGVQLRRINLYKDGEPTLHRQFIEMVKILKQGAISRELWTKTNGMLLDPEYNQRLIESGLDMIGVSINAVDGEGYLRVTKTKLDYDKLVAGVTDLCQRARGTGVRVLVKIANSGFSQDELDKFHSDFKEAQYLSVEQLHGWAASDQKDWTLGTNPTTFEGGALVDKVACPLPFFMLAINWNGAVSLCNDDWLHATTCGDIRGQTLKEIWQGEELRKLRIMHLEGRRKDNAACGNCSNIRTLPDNIDLERTEILQRVKNAPAVSPVDVMPASRVMGAE